MAFIENLSSFLADFGVAARGGTATLNSSAIDGIFDNSSATVLNILGGSDPIFACPEANLMGVDPRGQILVIAGISGAGNYIVRENKPDGSGWTVLELDKQ